MLMVFSGFLEHFQTCQKAGQYQTHIVFLLVYLCPSSEALIKFGTWRWGEHLPGLLRMETISHRHSDSNGMECGTPNKQCHTLIQSFTVVGNNGLNT